MLIEQNIVTKNLTLFDNFAGFFSQFNRPFVQVNNLNCLVHGRQTEMPYQKFVEMDRTAREQCIICTKLFAGEAVATLPIR